MNQKKKIMNLALPAMAENVLQMLMGMVDNYLVAQLGLVAVSGVSVANNIIAIYQALFIALGAATSSLLAKKSGAGQLAEANQLRSQSVFITLLVGLVLGLYSILLGPWTLGILGTASNVTAMGGLYLSLIGGTIVILGLQTTFGAILRVEGKPRLPMYVSLLTNIINVILSAIAIYVFHLGIVGVSLGTILSRVIGIIILATYLPIKNILGGIRLKIDRNFLSIALPAAGERLMMRAGDVAIVAIIVAFGTKVVAGNAIGEVITQFNYMPGMGVATATVILTGHLVGQGNLLETKKLIQQSYWIAFSLMAAVGLIVFALGYPLTHLFTTDKTAVASSMIVIIMSGLGAPTAAGTMVYTALWQGLGQAKLPFYATTIGMWVLRIGLGVVLGIVSHLGLLGVWLATIIDNSFRWIFLKWRYHQYMKEM